MKKFIKKELKEICAQEVGRKSLKWIEKLVKPCLPISVGYNSQYHGYEDSYFYEFLHMGLTQGSAESSSTILNLKAKAPSPDSILRHFRFSMKQLELIRENVLYGILRTAKQFGAFKQSVDIAIDPFDDPYYGDTNDIHVIGSKRKAGTNWFHSFTHLDIILRGERFCMDFEKRIIHSKDSEIVEKLLKNALEMLNINTVMMDKEFYQVEIVSVLYQYNLKFIIPAPDTKEIRRLKKLHKNKLPCVVEHTMTSATGEQINVKLALVERENKNGKKEIHGFITNLNWDAEQVAEYYRNRWGIETNNRKRNEFRPLTTSRCYELRYLYHLLSTVLHNIWILVNLIVTKMIHGIIYDPEITVRIMKELIIDEIKLWFNPAWLEPSSQSYVQFPKITD